MRAVKIFAEGGGNSKDEKVAFRKGMSKLIEKAGFKGKMPSIVACGGRGQAFDDFCNGINSDSARNTSLLLVDSEDPLDENNDDINSSTCWQHLNKRDGWEKPREAQNCQVALMATCMETWFVTDRAALSRAFGGNFNDRALPNLNGIENRNRHDLLAALENASAPCGRGKGYEKGKKSYALLEHLDPETLKTHLIQFKRFISVLQSCS